MNLGCRAHFGQFAPQMVHMNRDSVRRQFFIDTVEFLFQYSLGHHSAEATHQMLKDCKFLTGKLQSCSFDTNVATNGIKYRIASLKRGAESETRPAQQRLRSGNE